MGTAIRLGSETRYDTETLTADLTKVLAVFGFERMVLVGHSLGAAVAMRFAAENAARTAGLIIVDLGPNSMRAASMKLFVPSSKCRGLSRRPRIMPTG